MGEWLHWLNQNGGAVTAGATVAGVLVASAYSLFAALQWRATKAQADITQRAFEATHRPYLSLRVLREDTQWAEADVVRLDAVIENVGTVPAEVTQWQLTASLMDLDGAQQPVPQAEGQRFRERLLGACIFPGREYPLRLEFREPGIQRTPMPLRVFVTLEYRGATATIYRTTLEGQRTPGEAWQRVRAT